MQPPAFFTETIANKIIGYCSAGLALTGVPVVGLLEHIPEQSIVTGACVVLSGVAVALLKTRPATINAETARADSVAERLAKNTQEMFERQEETHRQESKFLREQVEFFKQQALDAQRKEAIQVKAKHEMIGDRSSMIFYIRELEEELLELGKKPRGITIKPINDVLEEADDGISLVLNEHKTSDT